MAAILQNSHQKLHVTISQSLNHLQNGPRLESVKCLLFYWINVFKNTLFIISTPENIYSDKNISILGGLEAEILTRVVCELCRPFLNGVSKFSFWSLKFFCFVSGLQNIHLDIDIQNICGLEADIKIIDTYHIFGRPFC